MHGPRLTAPSPSLLDGKSLFLDLDGTLFDLVDRPEDVKADAATRRLLERLRVRLEGRIAIVSGRSLAQIDFILGHVAQVMALSGSHGSEHRWHGVEAHPARPPALDEVAARFRDFAAGHEGLLVEEKSFGVVLHYRQAPQLETQAHLVAREQAARHALQLQEGNKMVELRMPGGDKGTALRRLMERAPMAGTLPVFVGDDVTDEEGFAAAVSMGGEAVLVGPPPPTHAPRALPDPAGVHPWRGAFAA